MLWCTNLTSPWYYSGAYSENNVLAMFSDVGRVVRTTIPKDKTGQSRHVAILEFEGQGRPEYRDTPHPTRVGPADVTNHVTARYRSVPYRTGPSTGEYRTVPYSTEEACRAALKYNGTLLANKSLHVSLKTAKLESVVPTMSTKLDVHESPSINHPASVQEWETRLVHLLLQNPGKPLHVGSDAGAPTAGPPSSDPRT